MFGSATYTVYTPLLPVALCRRLLFDVVLFLLPTYVALR